MNKIIEQVLEFLECDSPRIAIKEFLEDELKAIEKEKLFIGLKDINNNKIYADCSIVEFDYMRDSYKAYFSFDEKYLKYKLIELNGKKEWEFSPNKIENLKIIDTIQENKLGLIK